MDSVPLLHRYYRKLRLPAILPLASLRLGCAYHLRVCSFAPAGGQTQPPRAGNLGCGVPLSACQVSVEMAGPPRFLGSPSAYMPCSSTPAGPRHQASSVLRCCLPSSRRRRLPQCGHFGAQSHGLHARCLRFAAAVTRRHARLASGGWPTLSARDWLPAGLLTQFHVKLRLTIPSDQAFLAHRDLTLGL
jgi:hypothetical protein